MSLITHLFHTQLRVDHGMIVSSDSVNRRANLNYDDTGTMLVISIIPSLSPKVAYLVRQDGFTLYYRGEDPDYRFEIECWPDNGTIKRLSVIRDDTGIEYRYLGDHEDALFQ